MTTVPFNVVDESVHLLDTESEPWSIQLEVRVAGSLEPERLRAAVDVALSRHEMTRARKTPSRPFDRTYTWEIRPTPDLDPLRVVDCLDDEALASVRAELQSLVIPLVESPPLRMRLARHPGGDVVMLNVSHAAIDGYGALRVLQSIAREYAGRPDPVPDLDLVDARHLTAGLAAPDKSVKGKRLSTLGDKMGDLLEASTHIVPDGGSDTAGYGFHHVRLSRERTEALSGLDHPATVNDVLLAALNLAIESWNLDHGVASGRIGVMMPVNLRPKEWWQEMVGNRTLMARVATSPADRASPTAVLDSLAEQTSHLKKDGTAASLIEVLRGLPFLPLWAKRAAASLVANRGSRLVDTALLSNLGELDELPDFGPDAGETTELWFSAPAKMPLGLAMGVATAGGRLHLAFRYRHPLFGPDAARRFAERYLAELDAVVAAASEGERPEQGASDSARSA